MSIDTSFLERCLDTLDVAIGQMRDNESDNLEYQIGHDICDLEFERVLEQSGKLLRKRLAEYFASNRQADALTFRNSFRHAAKHGLMDCAACERWLEYRDHADQNEYQHLSDQTLKLLPQFSADARALAAAIQNTNDD